MDQKLKEIKGYHTFVTTPIVRLPAKRNIMSMSHNQLDGKKPRDRDR